MKNKIIILALISLLLLSGCNKDELVDMIDSCEEINLTQDNTYNLQDGWIRCCNDWEDGELEKLDHQ